MENKTDIPHVMISRQYVYFLGRMIYFGEDISLTNCTSYLGIIQQMKIIIGTYKPSLDVFSIGLPVHALVFLR